MSDIWDPEPYQLAQLSPRSGVKSSKGRPSLRLNVLSSSRDRIHGAIEMNSDFVVRTLLCLGTDINEVDSLGRTPLIHAAICGRDSICQLLLENGAGAPASIQSIYNVRTSSRKEIRRAIRHATKNYEDHVMRLQILLVQAAMDPERELLCHKLLKVRKLVVPLTHIRQINSSMAGEVKGRIDLTGHLHFAITNGGGIKVVELLLAMGADIEELDDQGQTPLANASCQLQEDVCKILLEKGANTQSIRGIGPTVDVINFLQIHKHHSQEALQTVLQLLIIMKAHVEANYTLLSRPEIWSGF